MQAIKEIAEQVKTIAERMASRSPAASDLAALNSECAVCRGTQWEPVPGKGARPCPVCAEPKRQRRLLSLPEFANYHTARLGDLQADVNRHWKQPLLVERMRQQPEDSYALFGLNRIGKTHLCWCLYRHAVEAGRPAIAVPAYSLLEKLTQLEHNDLARPAITADVLLRAGQRWCVFVDDLTALPRFSQFAVHAFYKIFNAIAARGHQLLVTAHATQHDVEELFNQGGFNMGGSILGRIREANRMQVPTNLMITQQPERN